MTFEQPPRPRWGLRIALAAGCALVLALGVVTVSWAFSECGSGTSRVGNECVGVTFGDEVFSPELADVERRIRDENAQVEDDPYVVTVAVLMPMTAEEGDSLSIKQIQAYLEGAHVAQLNANAEEPGLKIRLALANEGSYERSWDDVTNRLINMVESDQLVAVTGLGLSSPETVYGASKLAAAGIPMVGYLSADRFNSLPNEYGPKIAGLTRVSPSLKQELSTVAEHLDQVVEDPRAMLVRDDNPNDYYTDDLRRNFEELFREEWERTGRSDPPYTGGRNRFGVSTQFGYIADRLCGEDDATKAANVVLYAGRSNLLGEFVDQVRKRSCNNKTPITIITGSESTDLSLPREPGDGPVSVVYASAADPAALGSPDNPQRSQFTGFESRLKNLFGTKTDVSNWSVMGHDATFTATLAAQRAVKNEEEKVPTAEGVRANLYLLNSVPGASGTFQIDGRSGDRVDEDIPVLRRIGNGEAEVVRTGTEPG
ncbi:hypothetical protein ABZ805_02865 [Saccharopolyspora sp. NPDC047091]|uniref:ABC transporter substrate-binding protein n=1 Tax=Saccharopolyspora sp. NPDC047091 TaxID=3155924 RepID=UPI0033E8742C